MYIILLRGDFMWYNEAIFYQFYPMGICGCADYNNFNWQNWNGSDNPLSPDNPNNIKKIISWIPHLQSLGINAVYFSPVFQSDRHGYDTRDYYTIDSRLGSNEDFAEVCKALHQANIRVVLDGVFNHVGRGFWAFLDVQKNRQNSPYKDWFYIDWNRNSNNNDGFWYEGWEGHFDLVKLNLDNLAVQEHLFGAIKKWKDEFDIDGLRLDVAYCLNERFLANLKNYCSQFTDGISKEPNSFFILGETIYANDMSRICPSLVNSCTNYEVYKGMYSSLNSKNLFEISYSLNRQYGNGGIFKNQHLLSFVDNHDVERISSLLSNKNLLPLIYAMLFTIPGLPCIYYGSEWGIEGKKSNGDKCLRPWFENPQWNDLTTLISKLSDIRKNLPVLNYGDYENIFIMNEQLIYKRILHCENSKKEILVALNVSENNYYLKPNNNGYGAFAGIFGNWKNLITDKTENYNGCINLEPYSFQILESV